MREMHLLDKDMLMKEQEKRLNLEFDWKRKLVAPEMVPIGRVIGGESPYHIALKSQPHRSIEAFNDTRSSFDEWRKTRTLKTMEDWDNWREFERRKALKASGELTGHGKLVDQCKRQFLRDFAGDVGGMKDGPYRQLADWLTEQGYPTTVTAIKNANRSTVTGDIDWEAEDDEAVQVFLAVIRERYDWQKV